MVQFLPTGLLAGDHTRMTGTVLEEGLRGAGDQLINLYKAGVKTSDIGSSSVDKCVVNRFYSMQFPKPKGGGIVIVSYPFIFSPG